MPFLLLYDTLLLLRCSSTTPLFYSSALLLLCSSALRSYPLMALVKNFRCLKGPRCPGAVLESVGRSATDSTALQPLAAKSVTTAQARGRDVSSRAGHQVKSTAWQSEERCAVSIASWWLSLASPLAPIPRTSLLSLFVVVFVLPCRCHCHCPTASPRLLDVSNSSVQSRKA